MQHLIKSIAEASTLFDHPRRRIRGVHRGDIVLRNGSITNGMLPEWVKRIKKVEGDFSCSGCYNLKTLEGMPEEITGSFNSAGCIRLKSLEHGPKIVGDAYDCAGCFSIIDFKGVPETINGNFTCNRCRSIKSFETAPKKVKGDFIALGIRIKNVKEEIKVNSNVEGSIIV